MGGVHVTGTGRQQTAAPTDGDGEWTIVLAHCVCICTVLAHAATPLLPRERVNRAGPRARSPILEARGSCTSSVIRSTPYLLVAMRVRVPRSTKLAVVPAIPHPRVFWEKEKKTQHAVDTNLSRFSYRVAWYGRLRVCVCVCGGGEGARTPQFICTHGQDT